ncbi:MAG: AAA family ATPase [Clostridia bacterium]|nr:AAA family ATPase [Clostridia bacterium]
MENLSLGNSKVLILKNALICDECQSEIEGIYISKIIEMSETINSFMYGDESYEFIPEQLTNESDYIPKKVGNYQESSKKLPVSKKSQKVDMRSIYNKITKKIIGQDDAVKTILSTIIRNSISDSCYTKSNIFLIGGTGNGKSETVKQIANELGLPYVLEDSSKFTQEGYVGESVENAINKLIIEAGEDITRAERGIIIFDEIDKKTSNGEQSGVSTTSVQDSLLKMLEGTTFHTKAGKINTERITFILIGACEETYNKRDKRLKNKGKIGFTTLEKNDKSEATNPRFIPEDLIESGFKSELIGRIDTIQEFKPMDVEMATQIINNSEISIFNLYIKELEKLGVKIVMNRDEVVNAIAKRAVELKTGARAIRQIVVEMFKNLYTEVLLSNKSIKQIYHYNISKDTVYDNNKYELCKKEEKQ